MNDHSDQNLKTLSLTELEHIDQVQAQFRAAWESGARPRIEDFLADASDEARAELLVRLLAEEVACRSRGGETPTAEEYAQRFPADAETIRQAFNRSTPFPAKLSEHNTHSHELAVLTKTETQAWEPPPAKSINEPGQPKSIGRYKVLGVLGSGGFGTVYRARDEQLERDVAIKVWRRDRFVGDEAVEHLLQEARHVARLDEHPSIVGVHDVGRQQDGSAFVVFQYIEGHSLADELKSHPLPPDRVWEVMIQVTSAIQHAHATGLVHRDLKPANVLLDKDGNAHVADFGLAVDDQSQRLHAGEVSGTPAYMSPEQVRGEAHRLDGRTDLWALGVMLYEMLVHRRPFQGQTRQEVFDEILHRDPKPPRQLDPQLPADLERICLKCLSKDATQRYLTAADLAKDLRHAHQAPQRRKRRMMTIASVVAAGLLVLAAFWGYFTQRAEPPVISVQPGAGLVIRHRATLRGHSDAVWSVALSPNDRTLASAGVDRTIKLWDVLAGHEVLQLTGHRGEVRQVVFSPDGLTLASASGDRSLAVWDRETGELQHQITGHEGDVRSVTFLPEGNRLVSGSVDRTIRFWEWETASQQQEIATHRAPVQSVVCSRDGTTLASASDDRTIQLLTAETGEFLFTMTGHTDGVTQVAFSPDGRRLVSASWDKTIRIWDVASGKLLRTIDKPASAVRSIAFSPDGRRLVSGGEDHTIRLWDAQTGVELATLRGHQGSVTSVAFSSDGRILASASADKTVMTWELEEASPVMPIEPQKPAKVDRKPVNVPPAPPQEPPLAIAPFDADTARKHQEAWAEYLGVPVEFENSIGMKFVLIPPGEFDMGSTEDEVQKLLEEARARSLTDWYIEQLPSEAPMHRVRITKPFYLGATEVTQAQYEQVMGANPSRFKGDPTRPVEMVSWNDAVSFCEKLDQLSGEQATVAVYRLPTEAEWEYACRAGTTTRWYGTDEEAALREQACFASDANEWTHSVGLKTASAWGLYDMHGNVWEWCQDWFAPRYYAWVPTNDNPMGPEWGSGRVARGGGWGHDAFHCRSAFRGWGKPDRGRDDRGFRVAMTLPQTPVGNSLTEEPAEAAPTPNLPMPKPGPATSQAASLPPGDQPSGSPPPAVAPFDAAQAKQHQEAWAEYLGVPVEFENSIGMKFVLIPPGEFMMGSTEEDVARRRELIDDWEKKTGRDFSWLMGEKPACVPTHHVELSVPFFVGIHEVTVGQFRAFVEATDHKTAAEHDGIASRGFDQAAQSIETHKGVFTWRNPGFLQTEGDPVCVVNRLDAEAFCKWLSHQEGRKYRLPTEAEWEYACRCGTTATWYSGDDEAELKRVAWYSSNAGGKTHPVGTKKPNAWGLYDMHGNVREWCWDRWSKDYYAASPLDDPTGPEAGLDRVYRGGAWLHNARHCRSALRFWARSYRSRYLGFRVAFSSVDASGR